MSFADRTETVTRFFEDMCVCCCGKGVAQGWTEMSTSYKKSLQPRKLTLTHTQPLWREATASAIVVPTFSC